MDYTEAARLIASPRWQRLLGTPPPRRYLHEDLTWLQALSRKSDHESLPNEFHEVWYAHIVEMRHRADIAELGLIQSLRDRGVQWSRISDVTGAALGTRQAVQQRWDRLKQKVSK